MPLPCAASFPSNARPSAATTMQPTPRFELGPRARLATAMLALAGSLVAPSAAASSAASGTEPRELRGVRIAAEDESVFASRASIAEALDFLERHHVNVVFPDVWYRGVTLHPSALLEKNFGVRQDPRYAGRDPLAEMLVEAHVRGIEVVPWFEYGFAASSAAHPTKILAQKPAWAAVGRDGKPVEKDGFTWMNSLDPAVQEFVAGLMLEVARNYDVDGVQCDDRLPALPATGGYDKDTLELWRTEKRLSAPGPDDARWIAWRAGRLTDFFARLAKDVRVTAPGLLLSASPAPYPAGLEEYLQDSKAWLARGLVDLFHPLCFRRDVAEYQRLADEQRELLLPNSRVVYAPGILIESGAWRVDAQSLVLMLEHGRDRGYGGEVLCGYAGLRADDGALARALLAGPYEQEARVPHRALRWRPKAHEVAPRPLPGPEAWTREDGHVRMRNAGRTEVSYPLVPPVAGWFQVLLEVPDAPGTPKVVERTFAGSEAPAVRVALAPGLVDLGTMKLEGPRGRVELRIATAPDEAGRLAVGRVLLALDRRRSPDVVWREN